MRVPLFAPFESFDHGLAELLTLTVKIKDKALRGQLIMALARLEQNAIQNCSDRNTNTKEKS